jgi:hypothetical protein
MRFQIRNSTMCVSRWPGYLIREVPSEHGYKAEIIAAAGDVKESGPLLAEVVQEGGEFRFYCFEHQVGRSFRSAKAAGRFARSWVQKNLETREELAKPTLRVVVALVVGFLTCALITPSTPTPQPAFRPAVPSAAQSYSPSAPAVNDVVPGSAEAGAAVLMLTTEEMQSVQALARVIGSPREAAILPTSWFEFADPLCPVCHEFEPVVSGMAVEVGTPRVGQRVVIPVGVRGDLSDALVASYFEASAGDEKRESELWKLFMSSEFTEDSAREFVRLNPASSESIRKAQLTASLFRILGLKKTPTIVASDGRLGGPASSSAELKSWLGATPHRAR